MHFSDASATQISVQLRTRGQNASSHGGPRNLAGLWEAAVEEAHAVLKQEMVIENERLDGCSFYANGVIHFNQFV